MYHQRERTATDGMMVAHTSRRKRKTTSTTSNTLIMERNFHIAHTGANGGGAIHGYVYLMVGGDGGCRCGISAITLSRSK